MVSKLNGAERGVRTVGHVGAPDCRDDSQSWVTAQEQEIQRFVEEGSIQVVDLDDDEAHDGESMKRPVFQSLLATAQSSERAFDVVLVW